MREAEVGAEADPMDDLWSERGLLARAHTFGQGNWFAPPPGLSPFDCAPYGWLADADAPQTLGCTHCAGRVIFSTTGDHTAAELAPGEPSGASVEAEELARRERAVVIAVTQQLRRSHAEDCPWFDNPCRPFAYQRPYDPDKLIGELRGRHDGLWEAAVAAAQPATVSEQSLQAVAAVLQADGDGAGARARVLLAVFGWAAEQGGGPEDTVLSCALCCRRCGVWQYGPEAVGGGGGGGGGGGQFDAPGPFGLDYAAVRPFDPLAEHCWYCPWVYCPQIATTGDAPAKAGWQQLLQACEAEKATPDEDAAVGGSPLSQELRQAHAAAAAAAPTDLTAAIAARMAAIYGGL